MVELLTLEELAGILRIPVRSAYKVLRGLNVNHPGLDLFCRVGKHRRFTKDQVERIIALCRSGSYRPDQGTINTGMPVSPSRAAGTKSARAKWTKNALASLRVNKRPGLESPERR
jgi:hypothetical protein